MSSTEVNKLLMRAVNDSEFRVKFLADPVSAGKEAGAAPATLHELEKVDLRRIRSQFEHLSKISNEILIDPLVSAGHSKDWNDRSNIHDNDGNIHDKAASIIQPGDLVSNPAAQRTLDPAAVRDALKDPMILKELENNPALKASLKKALKGG